MNERQQPDLDRVREAMRDHDEREQDDLEHEEAERDDDQEDDAQDGE